MTISFRACARCQRLMKAGDRACPFCEATIEARTVVDESREPPRMSRAARLAIASSVAAFGALAAGCSSSTSGDSSADAGADVASAQVTSPGCATAAAGTFACGDQLCEYPNEYCDRELTNVCNYMGGSVVSEANACKAKHVCACKSASFLIGPSGNGEPPMTCNDVPGGGVRITTDRTQPCAIGGCYGAPPARLERIASKGLPA